MLDERTRLMLEVANELTADDIEFLKTGVIPAPAELESETPVKNEAAVHAVATINRPSAGVSAGEYERRRTRESKISTACVGNERAKHNWWPMGTKLTAQIGSEGFTAEVVENPRVKSGRSILITSGMAKDKLCLTPTRAALEATENYRQANGLGRGGGVTNGWTFWQEQNN